MNEILETAKRLVEMLEEKGTERTENKVLLSNIPVGGRFQTKIGKFIVLEQEELFTKVISEELYTERVIFDENTTDYKESELRKLCDGEILDTFEKEFGKDNIITNVVDLTTVDMQGDYGTLKCKVRPLTFDEARKYNNLLVDKELDGWYWTCTPWSTKERGWEYSIAVVSPVGRVLNNICYHCGGVRPFCILKSNIFVSKGE